MEARDGLIKAVKLEHAVGFAVMPNDWRYHKVGDVLEGLEVVALRVEVRLSHALKIVVIDCLGLAEGGAGKALIARNADHLVLVEDQVANSHVHLQLSLHLADP